MNKLGGGDLPGLFNDPNGLAITGNILYVSNSGDDTVAIFDISSPTLPALVNQVNDGNLSGPTGLTTAGTTLYVANQSAGTVSIYSTPGDPVTPPVPIRIRDFGAGVLNGPFGLAIFTVGG